MDDKVCAIHQPNFFPWLGYYDKIRHCDKFVVLDDAQWPRAGAGGWMNRVAINIQGKKNWITAPVERMPGTWKINETRFCDSPWREKIKKTLKASYGKAPNFRKYRDVVFGLIDYPSNDLTSYNINGILGVAELLGLEVGSKMKLASSLNISSTSTERLIDITRAVGCGAYMSGGGADGYQEPEMFKAAGVKLVYQNFIHPVYPQYGGREFIQGLSIVDYIFNREE